MPEPVQGSLTELMPAVHTPPVYVTEFDGQGPTVRLAYRAEDGHVHELYYAAASRSWGDVDLTSLTGGANAADAPLAYVTDFPGQGPTAQA